MGSKGRWEGGQEKQIFLDFAVALLFLHPWAKDGRELNSLGRNPVVPEKPVATHLPEYFCSPLPNQVKKKKTRSRQETSARGASEVLIRGGTSLKPITPNHSSRFHWCRRAQNKLGLVSLTTSNVPAWGEGR